MKKRVAIIVDGITVKKQIYDYIISSKKSLNYEITHLIIQNNPNKNNLYKKLITFVSHRGFFRLINHILFNFLIKFESIIVKTLFKIDALQSIDLSDLKLERIETFPIISKNSLFYSFSDKDINKIREFEFDFIIREGKGILKGEILNVTKSGIISFHHGDNDYFRGGPPGFWEVFYKKKQTGFIVQKLNDQLDGGDVLYKGFISTKPFYLLNLFKLYEKSYPIMNIILEKLSLNKNELKFYKKKPYFNKLYTIPSVYVQFLYLFDVIKYISKKFFYKIFNKKYRWHVAYQFSESWKNIVLHKSKIIQNPKNRFLADPFVWEKNGEHFIFLEDYNFKQSKAKISVYKINKNKAIELGTALEENFHLSYPFLFSYNNELFMCPETLETNDIRIYKCLNFPLKWKLENILIKNIRAVDTNIFFKNKKWWLITNSNLKTNKDYQDQMYLFSNDNPLSSDWKNNTLNPILFNSRQTRNGGLIIDKDELYRVYQKNGFDFYGESLGISKIIDINQKIFKEKKLFSINANFFPNIRGIHTFNYKKGLVAIDFLKIQ